MKDGARLLALAESRIGESYVNVLVPKNDAHWHGPWDCAEFASWLVYQVGGFLYGCTDPHGDPATTEAYTGAWARDARQRGRMVSVDAASATAGAFLLRRPARAGAMGHIALSDGKGGTVEAMGRAKGVCRGKIAGRHWDCGILVAGMDYPTN